MQIHQYSSWLAFCESDSTAVSPETLDDSTADWLTYSTLYVSGTMLVMGASMPTVGMAQRSEMRSKLDFVIEYLEMFGRIWPIAKQSSAALRELRAESG